MIHRASARPRLLALTLALLSSTAAAAVVLFTAAPASAADAVGIVPGVGSQSLQPINFSTPEACPAETDAILVDVSGGGFVPNFAEVVPLTAYQAGTTSFPVGASWEELAAAHPGTVAPLDGAARLRLMCWDTDSTSGEPVKIFSVRVYFDGMASTYTMGSTDYYVEYFGPGGGTLSTDDAFDRPVNTAVTVPIAGSVSILDGAGVAASPTLAGKPVTPLDYLVRLSGPGWVSPHDPIVLRFEVLNRLLADVDPDLAERGRVGLFRNGEYVPPCDQLDALPVDPLPACVAEVEESPEGTTMTVHSTTFSSFWGFGILPPGSSLAAPASGGSQQNITVLIDPAETCTEFVWSIIGSDTSVRMSDAINAGSFVQSTGSLRPITITDCRAGAPAWAINGQVGDFSNIGDDSIVFDGKYLGWLPMLVSPAPAVASACTSCPATPSARVCPTRAPWSQRSTTTPPTRTQVSSGPPSNCACR